MRGSYSGPAVAVNHPHGAAVLITLRRSALEALRPPPRLRLSEWLEANLILPSGTSALPGPLRLFGVPRLLWTVASIPVTEGAADVHAYECRASSHDV